MGFKQVVSTFAHLPMLLRVKKALEPRPGDTRDSLAIRMENIVDRFGARPAIVFEGVTLTWREVNERANRFCHALKAEGVCRGDTVSLVMENRVDFVCLLVALHKIGAVASLINTNLTGNALLHCLSITGAKVCVFGEERTGPIDNVRAEAAVNGVERFLFVSDLNQLSVCIWKNMEMWEKKFLSRISTKDNFYISYFR